MNFRAIRALMINKYAFIVSRNTFRLMDLFFWPVSGFIALGPGECLYDESIKLRAARGDFPYCCHHSLERTLPRSTACKRLLLLMTSGLATWLNLLAQLDQNHRICRRSLPYGFDAGPDRPAFAGHPGHVLHSLNAPFLGFMLAFFFVNLLLMGWSLGLMVTGCILKWGPPAEALAWAVPGLVQPIAAVFYPVSVLPGWLQPIALSFPASHIFEGMRASLSGQIVEPHHMWCAVPRKYPLSFSLWIFFPGQVWKMCQESADFW